MLHTNNRLHGDGKVNTGVTTKLSKIKSCNRIVVKAYEKNNNEIWGKQPTNHTRIILGIKYKTGYHTALNKQKHTSHDKLLMAPQIKHN
jgi:hypothetical protein